MDERGVTFSSIDCTRIPMGLYTDPAIYGEEQRRIFGGKSWNYVALEAELPEPGSFKRTAIGDAPIILARAGNGGLHAFVNRCAHRGVQFCREHRGQAKEFVCPYHQWTYSLEGDLIGVPFRRGVKGQGGMPRDFDVASHGLQKLAVTTRHGVVFASFDHSVEPLETYLGSQMLAYFDRVFDGRKLRIVGQSRQRVPANWKLMFENIKDPYHASLLHVFLVTFGLFRADQRSRVVIDPSGRHAALVSEKGAEGSNDVIADIRKVDDRLRLADPRLLDPVREFSGSATVVMQTIWPNLIVQQQSNTLAMRQLVTRGPSAFDLVWTYFGYDDDDEAMRLRRLRQANLMGPSGLVSIDDSEVMAFSQDGIAPYPQVETVLDMGGAGIETEEHMVTEAAVRAFYGAYRREMGL